MIETSMGTKFNGPKELHHFQELSEQIISSEVPMPEKDEESEALWEDEKARK